MGKCNLDAQSWSDFIGKYSLEVTLLEFLNGSFISNMTVGGEQDANTVVLVMGRWSHSPREI